MSTGDAVATILRPNGDEWNPVVGTELERLLDKKFPDDPIAKRTVRDSTIRILRQCVNPAQNADDANSTGLVVGYVQSGKTLSFTSVAAAAHDNGFRCVAVIAGSSLNLADQNKDRLAKDLDIGANFRRPWHRAHNPTIAQIHELRTALALWDTGRPKTLLLTSLKHHRHVQNLGELIESLGDEASPMLLIDDEADQISLNTRVNQNGESANYSQILGLRDRAPRHTYLQTPRHLKRTYSFRFGIDSHRASASPSNLATGMSGGIACLPSARIILFASSRRTTSRCPMTCLRHRRRCFTRCACSS